MKILSKVLLVFYIASWTGHWNQMSACKEQPAWGTPDPYTGQASGVTSVTTGLCYDDQFRPMQKQFSSKSDAERFIKACPAGSCSHWRLEEVHD